MALHFTALDEKHPETVTFAFYTLKSMVLVVEPLQISNLTAMLERSVAWRSSDNGGSSSETDVISRVCGSLVARIQTTHQFSPPMASELYINTAGCHEPWLIVRVKDVPTIGRTGCHWLPTPLALPNHRRATSTTRLRQHSTFGKGGRLKDGAKGSLSEFKRRRTSRQPLFFSGLTDLALSSTTFLFVSVSPRLSRSLSWSRRRGRQPGFCPPLFRAFDRYAVILRATRPVLIAFLACFTAAGGTWHHFRCFPCLFPEGTYCP
uniref:Uncharacterized protein n=1 Tax=Panagrellus redivivus TaxID=6233 RepID=A0A7E4ZT46_PANRE